MRPAWGSMASGAEAHIVAQVAKHEGRRVFALNRPGDRERQDFARSLGVDWAGGSDEPTPEALDAAILFAPVGSLVPRRWARFRRGGTVVCAGIPHERHSGVSLRAALGRASPALGGQPDAQGR
jgi:propanol-preferring alcohol dehydrogenase